MRAIALGSIHADPGGANHKRAPVANFITKAVTVRKPLRGDGFADFCDAGMHLSSYKMLQRPSSAIEVAAAPTPAKSSTLPRS